MPDYSFFTPKDKDRREEIYSTLKKNIEKEYIHKIILLIDDESLKEFELPDKVQCVYIDERPTYRDWLIYAERFGNACAFQVMANADIEMIKDLEQLLPFEMRRQKTLLAISRYDINYDNGEIFLRQSTLDTGYMVHKNE